MSKKIPTDRLSNSTAYQLSLPVALLTTASLAIVLAVVWLVITGIAVFQIGWGKFNQVANTAETTPLALITQGLSGWLATPTQTHGRKNFLILGIDSLETRGQALPLTDTILLLSLDLKTGQINALSLPRDLWSDRYQNRINAIYAQGLQQKLDNPVSLMTQEITTLTQVPIHHTVVLSLTQVAEIVDLVGGVTVNVPQGFTDTQFPSPDVDVTTERNPAKLYQTVTFEPGIEVMSGQRALQYIRSRHAAGIQGSDDARSVRQQLIIESLMQQLLAKPPRESLTLYSKLYAYYRRHFATYFSVTELIATAKLLYPVKDQVVFQGHSLSLYPQNPLGVLYHPPESTTRGAWVYKIRNQSLLTSEVSQTLKLE